MNILRKIANSVLVEYNKVNIQQNEIRLKSSSVKSFVHLERAVQDNIEVVTKPVIQFNLFPVTLNPDKFKNPRSNSNPSGDLKALYSFRQLVDPIPQFSQFYSASASSTEDVYQQIVNGASVQSKNTFMFNLLNRARENFTSNRFSDMDGTPGEWGPVYATPEDWFDTSDGSRYQELCINLNDLGGDNGPYIIIGEQNDLKLTSNNDHRNAIEIDKKTNVKSIQMKYLMVTFSRPWLNYFLFKSGGWFLNGQNAGCCSSGKVDINNGILPLLPTGMLLAKDIVVEADWSSKDQSIINSSKAVSLGPIPIQNDKHINKEIHVVAWVSTLVPESPCISG